MTKYLVLFLVLHGMTFGQKSSLTIDQIMQDPKWMGVSPTNIMWEKEGESIQFTWNPKAVLKDSTYRYTLKTKSMVSIHPKDVSVSTTTSLDRQKMVWEKEGDLYLRYLNSSKSKRLTHTIEEESNPEFTLDGTGVIYKKGNDAFLFGLEDGAIRQLTDFEKGFKKTEAKKTGSDTELEKDQLELFEVLRERKEKAKLEYVPKSGIKKIYLEEKRLSTLKVSPSLHSIVFTTSEIAKNTKNTIVPAYVTTSGYTEDISARTKVGSPQIYPDAYLFNIRKDTVFKLVTDKLLGVNVEPAYLKDYNKNSNPNYKKKVVLSSFIFSPFGNKLICNGRSDDNKDRWILEVNQENGELKVLDHQHDEAWIGGPGIGFGGTLGFVDESTVYFQSEETGFSHLYAYDLSLGKKKALTSGNFEILKVELSTNKRLFYIHSNKEDSGEQHFYHLPSSGGDLIKITSAKGAHEASISPDESTLAVRYSYSNKPWELYTMPNVAGAAMEQVTSSLTTAFKTYQWREPKLIKIKAADNEQISARLYEPAKKNKKAVIFVHGAGYLQNAHHWWSSYFREYMFHNLLTDLGYTVLDIDYRGSAGYGRNVRTGIYRHMGGKDLSDHVDGAKLLVEKYGIDKNKIGIYGGSYGGFITLMALFDAPEVFKAGAALRPVTDWAAYNHGYTSNILNTPQTDSIAYARSSPINFAKGLKNNLLICHGMVDVNVHYQDAVRLSQRLIELKKENWELASYPMEDHGFVEPSSWTDEYKRILKLFEEKLK